MCIWYLLIDVPARCRFKLPSLNFVVLIFSRLSAKKGVFIMTNSSCFRVKTVMQPWDSSCAENERTSPAVELDMVHNDNGKCTTLLSLLVRQRGRDHRANDYFHFSKSLVIRNIFLKYFFFIVDWTDNLFSYTFFPSLILKGHIVFFFFVFLSKMWWY